MEPDLLFGFKKMGRKKERGRMAVEERKKVS